MRVVFLYGIWVILKDKLMLWHKLMIINWGNKVDKVSSKNGNKGQ